MNSFTAKLRLKLKKVGKTTTTFMYELNQIPNDYTVEMTNRFKGLDLTDSMPEELWMEVPDIVWEHVIKTPSPHLNPQEKEIQEGKIVSLGGVTNR